ncbi:N-acetylmuramoyl-L-alanine amidase [Limosilactobacillus agrestimuris]|uniref:N-acetylmuramoyl-L-alanine amidase n=1 Tax=Limosilactobacillus agrestimuris TaxID=2941331 RepID=UPI0020412E96|nr:N-acetylmuramoyl-L-alanine amidase [Limosilactobacillus agrestimuris]
MKRIVYLLLALLGITSLTYGFFHFHGSNAIHYVNSATLKGNHFYQNGWYYDGNDWAYVRNGHKLTRNRTINNVQYHFNQNGIQILPYRVNHQYELSANQGSTLQANNKYIILHDVGSEATGTQAASYMQRTAIPNRVYTNFIVGNNGIVYQIKRPSIVSWGAGTEANNNSAAQIELGRSQTQSGFEQDYKTYILLARDLAEKYSIPLTLDAGKADTRGLKSHLWVTQNLWGDHQDPYGYLKEHGISKKQLASDLANGI